MFELCHDPSSLLSDTNSIPLDFPSSRTVSPINLFLISFRVSDIQIETPSEFQSNPRREASQKTVKAGKVPEDNSESQKYSCSVTL